VFVENGHLAVHSGFSSVPLFSAPSPHAVEKIPQNLAAEDVLSLNPEYSEVIEYIAYPTGEMCKEDCLLARASHLGCVVCDHKSPRLCSL
jgi:hypothetical protein